MRNKQIGQAQLCLQLLQQIDDLRLNRDVQCSNGLIQHNELRVDGQRSGNPHPLTLSTGKLMGIAVNTICAQADNIQQVLNALEFFAATIQTVNGQRITDNLTDGHSRIQRGIGILIDHLHALAKLSALT